MKIHQRPTASIQQGILARRIRALKWQQELQVMLYLPSIINLSSYPRVSDLQGPKNRNVYLEILSIQRHVALSRNWPQKKWQHLQKYNIYLNYMGSNKRFVSYSSWSFILEDIIYMLTSSGWFDLYYVMVWYCYWCITMKINRIYFGQYEIN